MEPTEHSPSEPADADPALVIRVVRSGGFAGLRAQWAVELSSDDAADWLPLVEACPWSECASDRGGDAARDRFVWAITANERSAVVPERDLEGPWRELADRVRHASGSAGAAGPPGD